jgi:hypothetical protein
MYTQESHIFFSPHPAPTYLYLFYVKKLRFFGEDEWSTKKCVEKSRQNLCSHMYKNFLFHFISHITHSPSFVLFCLVGLLLKQLLNNLDASVFIMSAHYLNWKFVEKKVLLSIEWNSGQATFNALLIISLCFCCLLSKFNLLQSLSPARFCVMKEWDINKLQQSPA